MAIKKDINTTSFLLLSSIFFHLILIISLLTNISFIKLSSNKKIHKNRGIIKFSDDIFVLSLIKVGDKKNAIIRRELYVLNKYFFHILYNKTHETKNKNIFNVFADTIKVSFICHEYISEFIILTVFSNIHIKRLYKNHILQSHIHLKSQLEKYFANFKYSKERLFFRTVFI